jgi:hypothetical protein
VKSGYGTYLWPNGSTYSGEWINNVINGYVRFNNIMVIRGYSSGLMGVAMKGSLLRT